MSNPPSLPTGSIPDCDDAMPDFGDAESAAASDLDVGSMEAGRSTTPGPAASAGGAPPPYPAPPPPSPPDRWDAFFDVKRALPVPERRGVFTVYEAGGGLPATAPIVLCFHGAGYTALSFALIAAPLVAAGARVVAFDARGHGETVTEDDSDLSAASLAADADGVWYALVSALGASTPPLTVAVGHAMGGTIAVRAAAAGGLGGPALAGVVLVDVQLWGDAASAAATAPHMLAVAAERPPEFPTYAAALDFAVRSGRCRNPAAVTSSFVAMLREQTNEKGTAWVWRTPLEPTRAHWDGWYEGLDAVFLGLVCPKLLIQVREKGKERVGGLRVFVFVVFHFSPTPPHPIQSHRRPLTSALSVAQAQGKLQVLMLPQAGYAIHEDEPLVLADALLEFLTHFRIVPRPPPDVSGGGNMGFGGGSGAATPAGGSRAVSPRARAASGDLVGLGAG